MEKYFEKLRVAFELNADAIAAAGAKAYMRNISEFYGISSPVRRRLLSEFIAASGYPPLGRAAEMVEYGWQQPRREWQYTVMEMLARMTPKAGPELISLAGWMITHRSWWDTVDYVAPNIAGVLFRKYPEIREEVIESWMASENLWLQRACLIHQLKYRDKTDKELLFALCERLSAHPDFFIRKAIGWSLRQYSKYNEADVRAFVETHRLSPLSRREALKVIGG